MNLFIISRSIQECVEAMFDKHISKIILEAVQMLCTAKLLLTSECEEDPDIKLYKTTHKNHPVSIWVRTSLENYMWTLDLIDAMHTEWKYRYDHPADKEHKSYIVAKYLRKYAPKAGEFPCTGLTPFAQAMPDEYKCEDAVEAYRRYYQSPEKQKIACWKKRGVPEWYKRVPSTTTSAK